MTELINILICNEIPYNGNTFKEQNFYSKCIHVFKIQDVVNAQTLKFQTTAEINVKLTKVTAPRS